MSKNIYVGKRYVPKIMGQWDKNKSYESLSIVQYQGDSFTSKQDVPNGIEINNSLFWVKTGDYNVQVETYKNEVNIYKNQVNDYYSDTSLKFDDVKNTISEISYLITEFGALNDGTKDISSNLKNALEIIDKQGGGTLIFPAGEYKLINKVDVQIENNINIEFNGNALINGSLSNEDLLIKISGKIVNEQPLISTALKGSYLIESSIAPQLKENDIILIHSSDLWDSSRDYYYKGELCRVKSVQNNIIYLQTSLYDTYNAPTTIVKKIQAPIIKINGLNLKRNSNQKGIQTWYTKDIVVKNCNITGCREWCFEIYYNVGGILENNFMSDFYYQNSGESYGFSISSCQDMNISKNIINGGRHAITLGGQEPCRNITLENNTLSSFKDSSSPSIGLHENSEYIYILKNTINGGISSMGGSCDISNNNIVNNINIESIKVTLRKNSEFIKINNNTIQASSTSLTPIRILPSINDISIINLSVNNNIINSSNNIAILLQNLKTPLVENVIFKTATFMNNNVISTQRCLNIDTTIIDNLIVQNGSYSSTTDGDTIRITCKVNNITKLNNIICECNSPSNKPILIYNSESLCDIELQNCNISGNISKSEYSDILTKGNVTIKNNYFKNLKNGGFKVYGGNILLSKDNILINCDNPTTNTALKIINEITSENNMVVYATTPPAGTWKKGDRCFNSSPTVGQPKSWIYTNEWVSEGAL